MSFPIAAPDWNIYAGDTFSQSYVFKTDGTAINLSSQGWSSWVAKWQPYQGTGITLTVDASQASTGTIVITATPTQTEAMNGPGLWDLQASQGSTVRTWIRGKSQFIQDVAV